MIGDSSHAPHVPTPHAAESQTSASETVAEGRAKKKREPIKTLEEFFNRRAAKPASFLKDLREAERWDFVDEDIQAALESHAQRDKDFTKTTQLMAAAMKERDARFARPVVKFGEAAIRHRLAGNPHFSGVDLDAAESVEAKLDLVGRVLTPRLREGKRRAESTNLLLATILYLNHTEGLLAATAIEKLLATLSIEPTRAPDRQRARLVWLGERPKEIRAVLELLAPSVRGANELAATVSRLEANVNAERRSRLAAEEEVVRLSTVLTDVQKTVAEARAEIERLEETSLAAGVHADHDVRSVKARVAGLLDGQLRDLVATVDDALSVDPPQIDVAREKTGVVVRELERQVAWLRS